MTSTLRTACQRCRKRKIKCDLKAPRCGPCAGVNVDCQSSMLHSSRAASSLPPGYLESLEAEVARLEKEVSHNRSAACASEGSQDQHNIATQRRHERVSPSFDNSRIRDVDSVHLHPHLAYGLNRMIALAMAVDNRHPFHSQQINPLFLHTKEGSGSHPAQELTHIYLQNYFTFVHTTFPLLDKYAIQEDLRLSSTREFMGSPVLLMALAIGAVFSPDQGTLATYHATALFLAASDRCVAVVSTSYQETVQFVVLATLFSLFNSTGGSTWHLLGLAAQVCISQGLHQKKSTPHKHDDGDILNTAFWVVFVLDRIVSTVLGRPFSIQTTDVTAEHPCRKESVPGIYSLASIAHLVTENATVGSSRLADLSEIRFDVLKNGFSTQDRCVFDSFAIQLMVWTVLDPQHLLRVRAPEAEVPSDVTETLNLGLLQCHAQAKSQVPLGWPVTYAVFHAGVTQRLLLDMLSSQRSKRSGADAWGVGAPGLSAATMTFLKSFTSSFPGLSYLNALYERVLGHCQPEAPRDVAKLACLQNTWSRAVVRRIFSMSTRRR